MNTQPKPRHCDVCQTLYTPARMGQRVCGVPCATKSAKKARKEAVEAARVERKRDRARREAAKRMPDLISEAQTAFNAYIRARDEGQMCICCGKPFEPMKPGGSIDAGHFRSRGAAGHLRFNEDNCFAQRKNCNRPGGTTYAAFRSGVVARIGLERVLDLESNNTPHKWTREELIGIRDTYKAKLKEMKK